MNIFKRRPSVLSVAVARFGCTNAGRLYDARSFVRKLANRELRISPLKSRKLTVNFVGKTSQVDYPVYRFTE